MLYGPTISLIKLSILLLYRHIFAPIRRTTWLVYGGIFVVLLGNSITTALLGAFCFPLRRVNLSISIEMQQCIHRGVDVNLVAGLFNAGTDYYVLWIPLPLVWSLNLPRQKKIGIMLIFAQGLLYDFNFFSPFPC